MQASAQLAPLRIRAGKTVRRLSSLGFNACPDWGIERALDSIARRRLKYQSEADSVRDSREI
jgi:hypothetical protein